MKKHSVKYLILAKFNYEKQIYIPKDMESYFLKHLVVLEMSIF